MGEDRGLYLDFEITPQPDDTACGPSCLHAVYRFFGDPIDVRQVIREIPQLEGGGTLASFLGLHALRRGYDTTIYTCNLQLFDPTWFAPDGPPIRERLLAQMRAKSDPKLHQASRAYLEFLELGGHLHMEDITAELMGGILQQGLPLITGLSATWLYAACRERPGDCQPDDAAGEPVGHFVVVHGLDPVTRRASLADPYLHMPYPASHHYEVHVDRLVGAIALGIVTYDAKLIVIRPGANRRGR